MIHRQNYLDIRAYLHYCEHGRQTASITADRYRSALRHLLDWAGETPLPQARRLEPSFPAYLSTARIDGKPQALAPMSVVKTLQCARQFFGFARGEWPHRYKPVSDSWIGLLQPPRAMRAQSHLTVHLLYTLDEVLQIASVSTATLREARAQVAVAMLFLSGMRDDALASLPVDCVDVATRHILQLPERGVRTKNRKAAQTVLLEIPALLAIVDRWDRQVREALPANALWYATLTSDGMALTPTVHAHVGRNKVVADDVRLICGRAGVPYRSPHKLRHGHVVWSLKQAHTLADLKAISQNVMHSSVMITDGVYGNLVHDDVQSIIARLGHAERGQTGDANLETKLDELLELLRRRG
jgi:site-specific recombinase XerD